MKGSDSKVILDIFTKENLFWVFAGGIVFVLLIEAFRLLLLHFLGNR